jgi:hypothetical protein|uniref:Uncharacterized protein n=1 Tax=Mus musculus TaxID=10090 RepID=Q9CYI8_MOUSE|nr:unnamed protein product [Mus musculus]
MVPRKAHNFSCCFLKYFRALRVCLQPLLPHLPQTTFPGPRVGTGTRVGTSGDFLRLSSVPATLENCLFPSGTRRVASTPRACYPFCLFRLFQDPKTFTPTHPPPPAVMKVIELRPASLGCEGFNLSTSIIFIFVAKSLLYFAIFATTQVLPGLKPKSSYTGKKAPKLKKSSWLVLWVLFLFLITFLFV